MKARKINKEDTLNISDIMPFTKIESNKALNPLLYYIYYDDFVLMINGLSISK